jgi:hypothetical protein
MKAKFGKIFVARLPSRISKASPGEYIRTRGAQSPGNRRLAEKADVVHLVRSGFIRCPFLMTNFDRKRESRTVQFVPRQVEIGRKLLKSHPSGRRQSTFIIVRASRQRCRRELLSCWFCVVTTRRPSSGFLVFLFLHPMFLTVTDVTAVTAA